MSKKTMSRRRFLQASGAIFAGSSILRSPALLVMDAIARGLMDRAIASEAGITPKKWVDMRFDGAPPRWHYDLILQASDADRSRFIGSNLSLGTRFEEQGGRYVRPIYSTTNIDGIRAPHIWQFNVPAPGGNTRPMKELLKNFLNIRGIYTGNSGHSGNWDLHYTPIGAQVSLPALGADYSSAPISSVYYNATNFLFRSKTGKSALQLRSSSNLLNALLAPFKASSSVATARANEALVQSYMTAAREVLGNEAIARHPDSKLAKEAMRGARDLIHGNMGDLAAVWPQLKAKYEALISAALHSTIPGINDKPVGSSAGTRDKTYWFGDGAILQTPDIRTFIQNNSTISLMAESFAVTEFILLNNLSDSITVSLGGLVNMKDGTTPRGLGHDQHFVGAMPGILLNSLYAMAHAACLLELIHQLPQATWKNTVINCSGEMNRTPWVDGRGSDHSSTANLALYSGSIQGPIVLGNIVATTGSVNYPGTWGAAAPQEELNGKIEPGHAHNTVATVLGVPEVIAARPSLVSAASNGVIAPVVGRGKILV